MSFNKNRVAIMYDFDQTLIPGDMHEYAFIPLLNMTVEDFWKSTTDFGRKHNMDCNLASMYKMIELAKEKGLDFTYENLKKQGKNITYFEGVETWFDRINKYGESLGLEIEHYIISCGIKEIIEGTSIYPKFKRVYGCSFTYDEKGNPFWVSQLINYTSKTQYIYRIRKNILDDFYDWQSLNQYVSDRASLFPYSNMIYIGDGDTDVPSMKHIKTKGGHSICVYDPNSLKNFGIASKLLKDNRVNFTAPADYKENSKLDNLIKKILKKIVVNNKIEKHKN